MDFLNSTDSFYNNVEIASLAILMLPLLSFFLLFFFAYKLPRKGDILAVVVMGVTFLISLILYMSLLGKKEDLIFSFPWFKIFSADREIKFTVSITMNLREATMLVFVSFISFLVHLYSLEYMKGKRNYARYYPYLGIFTFAMMGIVLSDNLLITFMFWELVGFSSYLLIGFWYDKDAAIKAAKKAFLFNRIGDTGFLIAILVLYSSFRTFELSEIKKLLIYSPVFIEPEWITLLGLGIFAGCIGKSAQFPLQSWLPDAMEGPTPVSALLHSATMVAAGVFLLIKVNFILDDNVLIIIAFVGAITAIMGAIPALFQNDIKKVLAYSTISQLGYMIMAIGVDQWGASFFHLLTHGFFKACLFLSAGAVIHSMHHIKHDLFVKGYYKDFDSQDMKLMGGFRKKMPLTFYAYTISAMALIGIPFFTGFFSKDAILEGAVNWAAAKDNVFFYIIPIIGYVTIFITALYMVRQILLIFFGEFRLAKSSLLVAEVFSFVKDTSLLIKIPLLILTIFCVVLPFGPSYLHFAPLIAIPSIIISISGIMAGYYFFRQESESKLNSENGKPVPGLFANNWYLDSIYYYLLVVPGIRAAHFCEQADKKIIDGLVHFVAIFNVVLAHVIAWFDRIFIDGLVNLVVLIARKGGAVIRSVQSGKLQGYYVFVLLTMITLIVWIIIQ